MLRPGPDGRSYADRFDEAVSGARTNSAAGAVRFTVPRSWQRVGDLRFRAALPGGCSAAITFSIRVLATSTPPSQLARFVAALGDPILAWNRTPRGSWALAWSDGRQFHGDTSSFIARNANGVAVLLVAPRRYVRFQAFAVPTGCGDAQLRGGPLPAALGGVVAHAALSPDTSYRFHPPR